MVLEENRGKMERMCGQVGLASLVNLVRFVLLLLLHIHL
jgi:hypothetical protein